MLTPRLRAAAPSRRAPRHLFWILPDGAAQRRRGPGARSRSASSAAPPARSGKLSPPRLWSRSPSARTRFVGPFPGGAGRVSVLLKLLYTHAVPHPSENASREPPFPWRALSHCPGAGPRGSAPLPLPFRAAPGSESEPQSGGGSVRPAVPSPCRSRRSARAARARRQLPGWVSGA